MASTLESAWEVLRRGCEQIGLDPTGATLIRIGSNAVFRLRTPVIVRISGRGEERANFRRQIAVARWLEEVDFPAARALPLEQPVTVRDHVATFWESVSEKEEYASIAQVALLIRRLHELTTPQSPELPRFQPFEQLGNRLEKLDGINGDDAQFLRDRATDLQEQYKDVRFQLPAGPIHGDANVGNVILSRDGAPILIDLDSFAIGPREWDLVQTALFFERFGWHTGAEYQKFVEVYGFDILKWPGYSVLAAYRELAMTLWLAAKAQDDAAAAAEVHKRVEAIRTNGSRRDWAPF